MSNSEEETAPVTKDRSLKAALEDARRRAADRSDSIVDMKAAEHARLAVLADELRPLMQDIDETDDRFDFALTNGEPPRLWIDMTSFVVMGQDRKTYRFLKDTRMGRIVLAETANMEKMADYVSDYVVDKVLERDRIMEGEREALKHSGPYRKDTETAASFKSATPSKAAGQRQSAPASGGKVGWFLLGILCCLFVMALVTFFWAPEAF